MNLPVSEIERKEVAKLRRPSQACFELAKLLVANHVRNITLESFVLHSDGGLMVVIENALR